MQDKIMGLKRICFIGQPYWSKKLWESIRLCASERVFPTHVGVPDDGLLALIKESRSADVLVRVGMRPGALTVRGLAFDAFSAILRANNPRARCVYYWIGTDVMNALRDSGKGKHSPFFQRANRDRHIAGAPWLESELRSIGIAAETAFFPYKLPEIKVVPRLPMDFRVLSYVPDSRYKFYGGESVYKAAQHLPRVEFDIIGGQGRWVKHSLPNLRFHGWVENVQSYYERSSLVIRLVEHDALGESIKEAMAIARHVIYSYPIPHTERVKFDDQDGLIEMIAKYHRWHIQGTLHLNLSARAYCLRQWNLPRLVCNLIEKIGD